jgi:hypothetical protein
MRQQKTIQETAMGYSSAYPTGRERFIFGRVEVERWRIRDGEGWY